MTRGLNQKLDAAEKRIDAARIGELNIDEGDWRQLLDIIGRAQLGTSAPNFDALTDDDVATWQRITAGVDLATFARALRETREAF